jgi:hypothetical protein
MMQDEKPEPPVGSDPGPGARGDSAENAGHALDKYLRGIDRPGPIFRNIRGVSSKKSVPDGGPRQREK